MEMKKNEPRFEERDGAARQCLEWNQLVAQIYYDHDDNGVYRRNHRRDTVGEEA